MFHFPWKFHSVAKGPPRDFLVQVEHTHLLEVYTRALNDVELQISLTVQPKYSNSPDAPAWNQMQNDRHHYKEVIDWLSKLAP